MNGLLRFLKLVLLALLLVGIVALPVWRYLAFDCRRNLDAQLISDVEEGRVQEVIVDLKEGADPNARDLNGLPSQSPMKQLIAFLTRSHGSMVDKPPCVLTYATTVAVNSNNPVLVELLLRNGADMSLCPQPPLLLALEKGDLKTAQMCLDYGADANGQLVGDSALRLGILTGSPKMVQSLIDHGARVDLVKDKYGFNDIDVAYHQEDCPADMLQIVRILKKASKTNPR